MEQIKEHGGKIIAWVIRAKYSPDGVHFVPEEQLSLQLGISTYHKGTIITPHVHIKHEATFCEVEEVVHIDKGKVSVRLYDTNKRHIDTIYLSSGDTIFFVAGGHGIRFLEDTRIIEVKRGPYMGRENDKRPIT